MVTLTDSTPSINRKIDKILQDILSANWKSISFDRIYIKKHIGQQEARQPINRRSFLRLFCLRYPILEKFAKSGHFTSIDPVAILCRFYSDISMNSLFCRWILIISYATFSYVLMSLVSILQFYYIALCNIRVRDTKLII